MIIYLIIFWVTGIIVALLGNRKLREYKDYEDPIAFLIIGIFICVFMSWAAVLALGIDGDFEFPKRKK